MADVYTDSSDDKREDSGGQKESSETPQNKDGSSGSFHGVVPPNPFGPRPMLKSDVVSNSSHSTFNTHPVYIAPSRLSSSSVFSKSQTSSGTDNKGSGPHKSSILAPSKLDMLNQTESSSPSKSLLRPSPLSSCVQNLKQKEGDVKNKEKENQEKSGSSDLDPSEDGKVTGDSGVKSEVEVKKDSDKETEASGLSDSNQAAKVKVTPENYFAAALAKSDGQESESSPKAEEKSGAFIFGQNLNERVTGVAKSPEKNKEEFVFGQNLEERVIKSDPSGENKEEDPNSECLSPSDKALTLEESAREFQARTEKHVDYKEVDVVTGEEGESNVMQATGKLFVFESHGQNWVERGRGLLRLNDLKSPSRTEFQSRLVMRTHGSLRVILNTKIWPGMTIERASNKSVRITATDGAEGIKVFLIMTSPKDSEIILRAVDWRIQQQRVREDADTPQSEKRKVDHDESSNEGMTKKHRPDDSSLTTGSLKREESDGSVIGPETDASSTSSTSSLTLKSESD